MANTTTLPYAQLLGDRDPLEVIRETLPALDSMLEGLTEEHIAVHPAPGKWSIHQIVAHWADCELVFQCRARMILFEDMPVLQPFDQDRWANGWAREKETFAQSLEKFRVLRESSIRLFANTPADDMRRTGTNPESGPRETADILRIMAGHDINHLNGLKARLQPQ
jgi:hypothetical protein